jgi:hypothetical protein
VITRWRHPAYFQEAQLNNFFDYTLLSLTLKYLYQLIKTNPINIKSYISK